MRVKFAYNGLYYVKEIQDIEELYRCIEQILSYIPISFKDDYNHRIRL